MQNDPSTEVNDNKSTSQTTSPPQSFTKSARPKKLPFELILIATIVASILGLLYLINAPSWDVLFFAQCTLVVASLLASIWCAVSGQLSTLARAYKILLFICLALAFSFNVFTTISFVSRSYVSLYNNQSESKESVTLITLTQPTGSKMVTFETERVVVTFAWDDVKNALQKNILTRKDSEEPVYRERIEKNNIYDDGIIVLDNLLGQGKYRLYDKKLKQFIDKVKIIEITKNCRLCGSMYKASFELPDGTVFYDYDSPVMSHTQDNSRLA